MPQRFRRSLGLIGLVAGVAACDSPSPGFMGMPNKVVSVDGSRFSVYYSLYQAQAIRTNPQWRARRGEMMIKGAKAIMIASGCEVVEKSLQGDAALIKADIKCEGAPETRRPAKRLGLDCSLYGGKDGRVLASSPEIECDVIRL